MGPLVNQCARARSMLAATHWKGSSRSAKSAAGSMSRSMSRSGADRMQVRARARQPYRPSQEGPAERLPHRVALPHLAQPRRRARRVGRHERAVDGAD